jgi:hypothetical protein
MQRKSKHKSHPPPPPPQKLHSTNSTVYEIMWIWYGQATDRKYGARVLHAG